MSDTEKYIVVFKDSATDDQISQVEDSLTQNGGTVDKKFNGSLMKGFSGAIPQSYLSSLQNLHQDVIDYIEPDQVVTTQ